MTMRYTELQPDVVESLGVVPRNYCHVWMRPCTNNKFYFGQAYHAMASFLRARPEVVKRRLEEAQLYKKEHPSYSFRGQEVPAFFPWDEDWLKGDIYKMFLKAVAKKEGQKTLVMAEPSEAVSRIRREGNVLSADVKSKSGPSSHHASIKHIFLTEEGDIDVVQATCDCPDYRETAKKGDMYASHLWDVHVAALNDELVERRANPNPWRKGVRGRGRYIERGIFSPFTYASNWVRQGNMLVPTSLHRAMLEVDMVVAHYLGNKTYSEINRKVSHLPNEYSDALVRAARRGEVTREVVRHSSERRPESERELVGMEKEVLRRFYAEAMKLGYSYECLYAELGDIALRFENRDNSIGFLPGRGRGRSYKPPVIVVRKKTAAHPSREDLCRHDTGEKNPFMQLNVVQEMFDDHTAVDEDTTVRVPTRLILPELGNPLRLHLPPSVEEMYRAAIEKYSPDSRRDLKRAGLFYR